MKKILFSLLFGFFAVAGFSQTCATPFARGLVSMTDTCLSPPDGTYQITVTATSDSALQIVGLNHVNTVVTADVNCNAMTFLIPSQTFVSGILISGDGKIIGPNIRITYVLNNASSGSLNDVCSGTYGQTIVAVDPTQSKPSAQVEVFPNPATQQTTIRMTGDTHASAAHVFRVVDLQGRVIAQGALDARLEAALDVSAFANGMYQVLIENGKGQLASKVLVVQ